MNIITKIISYITLIISILTFNFFLPRVMPGDPLSFLTGNPTMDMPIVLDEEMRAELLAYYGLDKPLLQQFTDYMLNLLHGNLGWSIYLNAPVSDVLIGALKWTFLLVGTATTIYIVLGIVLGAISAWNRGRKMDVGLLTFVLSVSSFPSFFLGLLFIILLGLNFSLFPVSGAQTPFTEYSTPLEAALDILRHLFLPAMTLVIAHIGGTYLLMRNSMLNVIGEDYIQTARAKGLSERYIMYKHAMKNALLPIITSIALRAGFMISGTIFVETVFAYPGVGRLLYDAVTYRDYPLLQGAFLIITLVIIAANFIADMMYAHLDPRVKHE
ncbi:ABC transporter permease [Methanosarcinales archaeon]|nr:MAG: ABC transporter permease [Methanosarcinales archaeon]